MFDDTRAVANESRGNVGEMNSSFGNIGNELGDIGQAYASNFKNAVVDGPVAFAKDTGEAAVAGARFAGDKVSDGYNFVEGKVQDGVQYAKDVKSGMDQMAQVGRGGNTGAGNIKIDSGKAAQSAQELRSVSKSMVSVAEQFEGIISRLLASGLQSDANSAKIKSYASQIKAKSAEKATKLNRFAQAIDEEVATVKRTENTVGSFDATVTIQ